MSHPMKQFERALLSFDRIAAMEIIHQAKDEGTVHCIEKIIVPSLIHIGDNWEKGVVALSQVYMSGRICEDIVDSMMFPQSIGNANHPSIAIALLEDYHTLGKRIIYSALRANGLELIDLGRVEADDLVQRIIHENIQILLISVLMLPTALRIKTVIEQLKEKNSKTKIIVGGAPFRFDDQLWKEVGADATGKNTSEAIDAVHRIIKGLSCH